MSIENNSRSQGKLKLEIELETYKNRNEAHQQKQKEKKESDIKPNEMKEMLKEAQDEILQIKRIIDKFQSKQISFTEAITNVKQMLGECNENITLQADDDLQERTIKRMEDELNKCVDFIETKALSPAEVIQNSTAVQGTFCTKHLVDWIEPRRKMVNIKNNVKFRTPTLTQRDNFVEHDSQISTNLFDKAVEKSGWGFATEFKASYYKVGSRFKYEKESQEENISKHHSSLYVSYFCKNTCSVVPVALWAASVTDLSLCKDVIDDLKKTEDLMSIKEDLAKAKVIQIFKAYGSHFFCGNIHFGGLFQLKTEFQTEKESDTSSIKDIVSQMHSASVNACFNVFGIFQIEGVVSGHKQYTIGKIEGNQTSCQLSKIHTSLSKLGGPIEIDSLGLWKRGLVRNNNSWVVVDGGKPIINQDQWDPIDFVGLWKLVQNESYLFKNSTGLSTFLLDTWHELSGLQVLESMENIDRIRWYQSKIIDTIEQSSERELTSESFFDMFDKLYTIVHECETVIGPNSVWKDELIKNKKLHSLLETFLQFVDINAIETGHKVKKLLRIASHVNFPQKAAVLDWLRVLEKHSTAKPFNTDKIDSIETFFKELKTVACHKSINDTSNLASLTGKVAHGIEKLLEKFKSEKAFIEYMVFVSFVILLNFDLKEGQFRVQLNLDNLSRCIEEFERKQEDLAKFKKWHSSDTELQALLFQNIIQSIVSVTKDIEHLDLQNKGKLLMTTRFQETKEYILEYFKCSVAPSIQSAIKHKDIHSIVDTLKEKAGEQELDIRSNLSWKYFDSLSYDKSCIVNVLPDDVTSNKQGTGNEGTRFIEKDVDRNMVDILKKFGLGKYFPEMISLQMAISIYDNSSANTSEKNIPWLILNKIISANSDFREKVLKDFWNPVEVQTSNADLLDDLSFPEEDDKLKIEPNHPSDVFLAIFQCCDPFLKRLIVTKLSLCQFAVPILFTDFINKDLVFSTWPINDIVLPRETETLITKERHSVSFIRIGEGSASSKSKLINEFLRELNEEHATFIHKDCPLGMNRRTVSKGMIEMSWLVPDPQLCSDANIKAPLYIFNLRGDAQEFERQLDIMLVLSNTMVISISNDDLKQERARHFLQKVHRSKISVILLTDMVGCKEDKKYLQQYVQDMRINKLKTVVISTLETKNGVSTKVSSSDLKEILTNKISKLLGGTVEGIRIQEIKKNLPEGIRLDESQKCVLGRELAESLLMACQQDESFKGRKDKYLPLQGKSLWHEISKREKDLKRTKSNIFDKEETILRNIRQLRKKQTDTCNEAPVAFSLFVRTLLKYNEDGEVLQYFIIWFKQMLNNQSRVLLNDLFKKFFTAFSIHESTKDNQSEEWKRTEELDETEGLLAEASFGIEHFFREIGQVYEAFMYTSEDLKCKITHNTTNVLNKLPIVVAKLLLLGHTFELMDGDAANVPQKWVAVVLKEVKNIVGPKKKILTVSILGIQRSGKSTLLNTMFGLEFSVNAGRCTRGIYIQLVPVKYLKNVNADYILVLDTEGLRAPERAGEQVHHDNEIATLVVGLADVVLLNLKGESISDMANILEIVITGLLRLQQVNKNLTLHQSCIFIHQNVSKDAQLSLLKGNRQLVKYLDTMTKDVAIQENIANIVHFANVIKFNPTADIKYIPDLFHGSPGTGPVNLKYSLEVTDVQRCILREKAPNIHPVTFENYLLHLQSLWQGIQAEDFIFSFRSILEIKSYGILGSEYQRLIWELEELKLEWMNNNIKPRLRSCRDVHSINLCACNLIKEYHQIMVEKYEESDKSLQDFVKASELQEHMEHYIANKLISLKFKKKELEQDTLQSIQQEREKCTRNLSSENSLSLKEQQIIKTARELARVFSGKKPTMEEMNSEFNKLWKQFLNELANEIPQQTQAEKTDEMSYEIEVALNDLYSTHGELLRKRLKKYAINKGPVGTYTCLMHDLSNIKIRPNDISLRFFDIFLNINTNTCVPQARNVVGEIFCDIDQDLDNLHEKEAEYNQAHFSAIMKRIKTKFNLVNDSSSNYRFTFTSKFEISVAVRVARHCFHHFQTMNRHYESKYGLQAVLDAKKPRVHQIFLDTCENQAEEIIATNVLCNILKISIEEKLQRELALEMLRKILQKFEFKKTHLMKDIMTDLATNGEFNRFIEYIRNPVTYVTKWLKRTTDNEIFQINDLKYSSYTCWLGDTIMHIIDKIKSSSKRTTEQSNSNMSDWMHCFQQQIKCTDLALVLNNTSFQLLSAHEIKSFDGFLQSIIKKLNELETELIKTWKEKNSSHFTWLDRNPYELIYNFLWGCSSKCPLCYEPCQKSDSSHGSESDCHNCIQHRPAGVNGTHVISTGELVIESCSFEVRSSNTLRCGTWCNCPTEKCTVSHRYRQYKKYIKEWDIEPLADMSNSKYWNWFMTTYLKQLAEYYGKQPPNIPNSWKSLTKDDAIRSLREVYVIT